MNGERIQGSLKFNGPLLGPDKPPGGRQIVNVRQQDRNQPTSVRGSIQHYSLELKNKLPTLRKRRVLSNTLNLNPEDVHEHARQSLDPLIRGNYSADLAVNDD